MPNSYGSGNISLSKSTLKDTREDIRINQLLPEEVLRDKTKLKELLEAYYKFLNIDQFNFTETKTFTDLITENDATFRIEDPELKNNKFFQQGSTSTMTIAYDETILVNGENVVLQQTKNIPLVFTGQNANVSIVNGNNLPDTLEKSTVARGKTFRVKSTGISPFTATPHANNPIQTPIDLNGKVATLTTIVVTHVGPGPSYVLNEIERNIDIDRNDEIYLDKIQKEIAPILPRNATTEKRTLYKQIIDFYKLRGSEDSLKTFFRIVFNEDIEIEFPIDKTLIPSSGRWEPNSNLVSGGQYLDNKGQVSNNIKLHDGNKFQKFSYVVKGGVQLDNWKDAFKKLVHPAGFKFFGEILILLALVNNGNPDTQRASSPFRKTLPTIDGISRQLFSAMPFRVPGVIGIEDVPVLIEAFASFFTPSIDVIRGQIANIQLNFTGGQLNLMTANPPGVQVINRGSGYIALPSITFTSNSGATNPVISFGGSASDLTADGGIDPDKITIVNDGGGNPQRGANITSIVASVAGPKNASNVDMTGKIVNLRLFGQANKVYSSAPVIQFTAPTAKDADGNLTGTTATATLQLDSEGEISGFTITNPGSGYILDPDVNLITGSQNEDRVQEDFVKQILSLNHQGNLHDGTHRTIINNSMRKRQGSNATTRLYNRNATIEAFGTEEIQNFDANDINNIDIQTYINIE
tara:strand:- start:2221 stop:4302 length:2082 start_codon:yes stop_codon:yes gene_type:complete